MKKNKTIINGDKNIVTQDTKINIGKHEVKKKKKIYQIIGILIAILTLIVTIIIGWNKVLNFFGI